MKVNEISRIGNKSPLDKYSVRLVLFNITFVCLCYKWMEDGMNGQHGENAANLAEMGQRDVLDNAVIQLQLEVESHVKEILQRKENATEDYVQVSIAL